MTYNYESFSFLNEDLAPRCVVVNFDPNAGGNPCGTNAHASAYVGDMYDPTNQSLNFVGDVGSSITQPFEFEIPGASNFTLVFNTNFDTDTCSFAFEVVETSCDGAAGDTARFLVDKNFTDDNEAEVEVTLSCNTGLPLEQTTTIAEGDPVNFVVGDFEQGTLDCEVTEVVPDGYSASYNEGDGVSDENCSWENAFGLQHACTISNSLDLVEVVVTKEWIDENPQFEAQNVAGATWTCSNVAFPCELGFVNECDGGNLDFFGNPGEDSFSVFPDWEVGTTCSITEVNLLESGIEVDDSDCQGLLLFPGDSASCTIVNTRLFEGIPKLSQYGLGLLALLMLGVGFVAYRRFA